MGQFDNKMNRKNYLGVENEASIKGCPLMEASYRKFLKIPLHIPRPIRLGLTWEVPKEFNCRIKLVSFFGENVKIIMERKPSGAFDHPEGVAPWSF
jgi:hypothetical protein